MAGADTDMRSGQLMLATTPGAPQGLGLRRVRLQSVGVHPAGNVIDAAGQALLELLR